MKHEPSRCIITTISITIIITDVNIYDG